MAIDQGHAVLPPPPATDGSAASQRQVAVPETSLLDVVLCDHRHTLTLFNHAAKASASGNTHLMELLSGALALDIRLDSQAVTGVLCPLLERRLGAEGAALGARLRGQLQALERDALEMLTFRRERDWPALAQRINLTHTDFASHAQGVEVEVLPRLATDVAPDELAACGLLFSQQKQAAPLAPQTGDAAFAAAAAVGPQAATVAGGPIVAGEYQQHHHAHPQQQQHLGSSGPGKAAPPPQGMQLGGEL